MINWKDFYLPPINLYNIARNTMEERQNESGMNEEEMYVEFTMIEVNEFIRNYGAEFFLSKLKYPNLMAIVRELK